MNIKGLIVIGAVTLTMLVIGFGSYFHYSNVGVDLEEGIDAQVAQNKNAYSTFSQTAIDQMNVANSYKSGLKEIIVASIEGRYGGPGQKSVPAVVNEKYPGAFDSKMFENINRVIEAGRRDFSAEQKKLISRVQVYKSNLRYQWSGMWLRYAGYPTIDLTQPQYNPIISEATGESFKTGVDKGIQFK
jgi:hypothetical protein